MALAVAAVLFSVFICNVVLGALAGRSFMGDVSEMLVLFAASIAFVVVILKREAAAKRDKGQ